MNKEEVIKLSKLARIDMGDAEAEKLRSEFEAILNYVKEVKGAVRGGGALSTHDSLAHPVRNVMREDGEGHESGIYTEKILSGAPSREGNYLKVKKIL